MSLRSADGLTIRTISEDAASFMFDGHAITASPLNVSFPLDELHEIGIESIPVSPLQRRLFLVLRRNAQRLRIPHEVPLFKVLLDYCVSLNSFSWPAFVRAISCGEARYSVCWLRRVAAEEQEDSNDQR